VSNSFQKIWKQFLDPALLVEARVKDVKAKYHQLDLAGFIAYAQKALHDDFGPKGVSKYLMWFARELHQNFKDDIEGDNHWHANAPHDRDVFEIANVLLEIIGQFQQHHQRLKEKDIYKYEPEELRAALRDLGLSQSQKRKREKEGAMEGSELIYDENDIFAIRPLTKEASCFYGKNTRWCISATESRNYFDQYTSDYQAFVMVRFDNIPADHKMHKLALVYSREGDLQQVFDALDDEPGESAVYDAVTMNKLGARWDYELLDEEEKEPIDEIAADIIQNGYMNVLDNPPDPTGSWDSEITNLEAEYQEKIKHGYYSAEVEDYGEGNYVSFSGGFTVEFDEDIFEGGEYEFPDNYRDLSELSREISSKFERVQIYHEDIDISDYNDKVTFEIRISIDGYEPSPQGYDSFLYQLSEHDKEYSTMQRIIAKHLAEEGYIAKGAFDTFQATLEELQKKLKNFNITDYSEYAGEEEIIFASKENLIITETSPFLVKHFAVYAGGKYVSEEVNQRMFEKLKELNQAIQTYLAQQLELPLHGADPRVVRKLTIPETLQVVLYDSVRIDENSIFAKVSVRIDNPEANQEEIDMIVDVVRFLDENYERVAAAAIESAQEVAAEVISAQKEFMDSLPQAAKDLLELGRKSTNHDAERRMRRVNDISIGEWKNRKEEIPTMNMFKSQILLPLFNILKEIGEIAGDRSAENPFYADEIDDLMRLTMESNKMNINIFEKLKEIYIKRSCTKKTTGEKGDCAVLNPSTKKQTACYDDCDTARAAKHMNEKAEEFFSKIKKESELDEKDNIIKSRKYEIIDIMDPDFNLWEVNDE